jgi:tetratricopeptide (TPR) repeat protein
MLRISLLVELAHLRWRTSGEAGTLRDAQTLARRARALLQAGDPAERVADVLATLAAIGHDLGDAASLDESLDALTEAIRSLQASGDAVGAAQLLNDQAAVWIRLGDPVRGAHLLRTSREIFEDRAQTEPAALRELAETEHLLARLPLHVAARDGAEAEALRAALEHAAHAEEAYRRLQLPLEVGRTLETRGRLLGHTGQAAEALAVLTRAVEMQQRMGDALGLARTTGALSEVLRSSGRASDALALLADSVSLNLATGSPIGLAHNRRALQALAERADDSEVQEGVRQLQERIEAGEQLVGRAEMGAVPMADPPD